MRVYTFLKDLNQMAATLQHFNRMNELKTPRTYHLSPCLFPNSFREEFLSFPPHFKGPELNPEQGTKINTFRVFQRTNPHQPTLVLKLHCVY